MRQWLAIGCLVLSALIAGVLAVDYVGPYRWAAEAQLALFDTHLVQLSFAIAWAIVGAPFAVVYFSVRGRLTQRGAQSWLQLEAVLGSRAGRIALAGATMAIVGGWLALRDLSAGPLTRTQLDDLEHGRPPASRYVDLEGATPLLGASVTFDEGSLRYRYIPLLHAADCPVVFARFSGVDLPRPLRGTLEENGLPGEVRTLFESRGMVGERHYMLNVDRDPTEAGRFGLWLAGAGALAAGLALAWIYRSARSAARAAAIEDGKRK